MTPADRIASAPKAWAVCRKGAIDAWLVSPDADRLRQHMEEFLPDANHSIVRVALVEIPEDEK